MTEKVLCIYDKGDNDGLFSAATIKFVYPDAVLVGWRFEEPISIAELEVKHGKFDTVIVCDLPLLDPVKEWNVFTEQHSMPKEQKLNSIFGWNVLWFDHHIGNKRKLEKLGISEVEGNFNVGFSAAKNVWQYFYDIDMVPEVPAIDYVETYDCWKKENGSVPWKDALNFHFGLQVLNFNLTPENLIELFFPDEVDDGMILADKAIDAGNAIRMFLENTAKNLQGMKQIQVFDELKIAFYNISFGISYLSDCLFDSSEADAVCCWYRNDGKYYYSLRTKKDIDLAAFAEKHGGGGHKQAAGFKTDYQILEG